VSDPVTVKNFSDNPIKATKKIQESLDWSRVAKRGKFITKFNPQNWDEKAPTQTEEYQKFNYNFKEDPLELKANASLREIGNEEAIVEVINYMQNPKSNLLCKYMETTKDLSNTINALDVAGKAKEVVNIFIGTNEKKKPNITEIPAEIGKLKNLKAVYIDDSWITKIAPEIGNLTELRSLSISNSPLSKLPSEIGNLTNLSALTCNYCKFTEIPEQVFNLTKLSWLSFSGNQITEISQQIGKLKNLRGLQIGENKLTTLPSQIGNITKLRYLSLSGNPLSSLPKELGNLKYLAAINLSKEEDFLTIQVIKILRWHRDKNHDPFTGSYSPAPI